MTKQGSPHHRVGVECSAELYGGPGTANRVFVLPEARLKRMKSPLTLLSCQGAVKCCLHRHPVGPTLAVLRLIPHLLMSSCCPPPYSAARTGTGTTTVADAALSCQYDFCNKAISMRRKKRFSNGSTRLIPREIEHACTCICLFLILRFMCKPGNSPKVKFVSPLTCVLCEKKINAKVCRE